MYGFVSTAAELQENLDQQVLVLNNWPVDRVDRNDLQLVTARHIELNATHRSCGEYNEAVPRVALPIIVEQMTLRGLSSKFLSEVFEINGGHIDRLAFDGRYPTASVQVNLHELPRCHVKELHVTSCHVEGIGIGLDSSHLKIVRLTNCVIDIRFIGDLLNFNGAISVSGCVVRVTHATLRLMQSLHLMAPLVHLKASLSFSFMNLLSYHVGNEEPSTSGFVISDVNRTHKFVLAPCGAFSGDFEVVSNLASFVPGTPLINDVFLGNVREGERVALEIDWTAYDRLVFFSCNDCIDIQTKSHLFFFNSSGNWTPSMWTCKASSPQRNGLS